MTKSQSIAHFVVDEKFIDSAFESFEGVAPGRNKYYVIGRPKDLKYVKNTPLRFIGVHSLLSPSFYSTLRQYSFVVLHQMTSLHRLLVWLAPKDVRFIWIGFGFDYYKLICPPEALLLEKTRAYVADRERKNRAGGVAYFAKQIAKRSFDASISLPRLLSKLSAFSPVLEVEYTLIRQAHGSQIAPYISWNYGSVSHLVDASTPGRPRSGGDILLGNSASTTNNHMEALDILNSVGIANQRIICPLSYGDNAYRDHVIEYGRRVFGDRFIPVTGFLPLDEYFELISGCSVFIANHIRQQGLGNVISMMTLGGRVFLNPRSPIYHSFREKGAHINNLDELIDTPNLLQSPLALEDVTENQQLLRDLMGSATIHAKTEELVNQMANSASR